MKLLNLYLVLIGCRPPGRFIEQHDVFLGVAGSMKELIPAMIESWPETAGKIHVDGWRKINQVNGYSVSILSKEEPLILPQSARLFFINLGGYKKDIFEEFHYKMVIAAPGRGEAIRLSKETAFYRHTGFKGATAHVDDKYGIDVDDVYEIEDLLPAEIKSRYTIQLVPSAEIVEDELNLGYFKLDKLV